MVTQDTSFISKRIMLPFELDICPLGELCYRYSSYSYLSFHISFLVICSSDCLAVGVESLPFIFSNGGKRSAALYSLHRNSEVELFKVSSAFFLSCLTKRSTFLTPLTTPTLGLLYLLELFVLVLLPFYT